MCTEHILVYVVYVYGAAEVYVVYVYGLPVVYVVYVYGAAVVYLVVYVHGRCTSSSARSIFVRCRSSECSICVYMVHQ